MKVILGTHGIDEVTLLMLHRLLVTSGIHHIDINHQAFRSILTTFFNFSFLYKSPGYISLHHFTYTSFPCPINLAVSMDTSMKNCTANEVISFIAQCDFIWVELSHQLMNRPWYTDIKKALINHAKKRSISIICVGSSEGVALK